MTDDLPPHRIEMPKERKPSLEVAIAIGHPSLDVAIESPAIRRLIEEVRAEVNDVPRSYNRTFNRHNR